MRSFSRRDMLRVGLLAAPVALHPLRVRAQEFGVAQVAGSGIPRTASQEKKLYLLLSLDARTFKIPYKRTWVSWGHNAIEAWTVRPLGDYHRAMMVRANSPTFAIDPVYHPFLASTPGKIDLYCYESEIEDRRQRVGSGRTDISVALFLPPSVFDELEREVSKALPDWDPQKIWCLGFNAEPFEFPSSRSVPAHRPISDCWYRHIRTDSMEVSLVERKKDASQPERSDEVVGRIIHEMVLRVPANRD